MVISYEFYPASNGTITCLEKIIPYLSHEWNITVFCTKKENKSEKKEKKYGAEIHRLSSWVDNPIRLKEKIIANLLYKKNCNSSIRTILLLLVKIIFYPATIFSRKFGLFYAESWEKNAYRLLNEQVGRFESIICIGAPFEDVKLANLLKANHPNIAWILIQFDLYALNPTMTSKEYFEREYELRIKEENVWYQNANIIIMQKEMIPGIEKWLLKRYDKKMFPLYIPTMDFAEDGDADVNRKREITPNNGAIKIVYTGLFYEDIRNPSFMLDVFKSICHRNKKVELWIVGYGCEKILDRYKKEMGDSLILCGRRAKEETEQIMLGADLLLNVSNQTRNQTPSKLMEYIATCKPIINFFSIEDDVCVAYLKDYPLSISVQENREKEMEEAISDVEKFITENYDKKCRKEVIMRLYEHFTAKKFATRLMELGE